MGNAVEVASPALTLNDIREQIFNEVDDMVLKVGALLLHAKQLYPGQFMRWVNEELPFGYDKARRLIAIYLAYSELDDEVKQQLPKPWQALYAITRLEPHELNESVANRAIHPGITITQAKQIVRKYRGEKRTPVKPRYSQADLIAGSLMDHHPSALSPLVLSALRRWVSAVEAETIQRPFG